MLPTGDEFTIKYNAYVFKLEWVAAVLLSIELEVYCCDLPLQVNNNDDKPKYCCLHLEKRKAEVIPLGFYSSKIYIVRSIPCH